MHYIPAPPGFTVVQTEEELDVTEDRTQAVVAFAVRTDPLAMYAFVDSEDRPVSVYPVLGATNWEAHLIDAMDGQYRWHVLPDDLVAGETDRLAGAHRKEVCGVDDGCPYGKASGNDRRGYGVIEHTEDCIERQRSRD